jgi:hypothetical protein
MAIKKMAAGETGAKIPGPGPVPAVKAPELTPDKVKSEAFKGSGKYPFVPPEMDALCVPIDSVKLDPRNARVNEKAVPKLAKLIRINGMRKPIVVDQDGVIRAGNTTWKACKLLGMTHIPIVESRFESETAAIAYSISDNKSHEYSGWDDEVLQALMSSGQMPSQDATGFSDKEYRGLQLSEAPPEELKTVDMSGASKGQGEFIIVRFDSDAQLAAFKVRYGMGKFERAIDFSKLGLQA